jgi:hypothetical protein
MGEIK